MPDQRHGDRTLAEAAMELKVSAERCRRKILSGELDGYQVAGRWFVRGDSLDRTVADRTAGSSAA